MTAHYICSCGAEKDETVIEPGKEHNYEAVLTSDGGLSTSVERLVCSHCGHVVEKNINYQVTYSKSFRTAVLDLNLLENETLVQPDGSIEMRFYVGDTSGRSYTVTRISPDGSKTVYRTRLVDGWLVFDADHFSVYTIAEVDESGRLATEEISYSQALEALSGNEIDLALAPADISGAKVTVVPSSYIYDGVAKTPGVTVTLDDVELPVSAYDVVYSDNVEVGTATVTVTGKDDYAGVTKGSFVIVAAPESDTISDSEPVSDSSPKPESSSDFGVETKEPSSGDDSGNASTSSAASQSMHRLYNPNSGEHFYTSDDAERDGLVALGWNSEGEGWTAPVSSATPVYRMYNPVAGEHHYTPDASERDMLIEAGWNDEGIGWYSDDEQTVPLYRDYNPNAFANNHNYTVDREEHEWLLSLGWRDEGYAWYGM